MDSQLTPVYNRLLNRDFLLLQCANLLLSVSFWAVVSLYPLLESYYLLGKTTISNPVCTIALICLVLGICVSGLHVAWLVERYRRNHVFLFSTFLFGLILLFMLLDVKSGFSMFQWCFLSFIAGSLYGVAGRVLTCTLLIDKTESFNRTRAGLISAFISILALLIVHVFLFSLSTLPLFTLQIILVLTLLLSMLCIRMLEFPFRAPIERTTLISFDRFFQSESLPWFFCVSAAAILVGYLIGRNHGILPFTILLSHVIFPVIGYGIFSIRILQIMTQCGKHCQRSTLLSTFFMAHNAGLTLGFALSKINF